MARFVLRSSAVVALMPCVLSTEPAPSSLRGFGNNVSQLVELTGPKPLDTPEQFLGQLSWNAQSSHVACRDDEYEIPGTLFGLIKHMDGNDDTNFYATDKAVAWASGSSGLTKDLQDCCGKEKKQCLCNIAKNVGLLDPNNNNLVTGPGNYSFIAFTSVDYSVVSPTWAELAKVLPNTTDWVFNDMKLTPEVKRKLHDQETCGLASTMQTLQDISRQYELGTEDAYNYVVNTYMPLYSRDGLCTHDYCGDSAVEHFCGDGGKEACDPSQFLCTRTDGYEVGYVRAYLHMFLDAAEVFQGNGCSQGSKADNSCVEEFIVWPNPKIKQTTAKRELVSEMPKYCTPDNSPEN